MSYSESDTKAKLITPKLLASGWDERHITREHYFTDGRKQSGGARGERKFVDYLLRYQEINLAVVEAKKESLNPAEGLQQSIGYGVALDVDYVYSTNGHKIIEYQISTGKNREVDAFPSPQELFARRYPIISNARAQVVTQGFFSDGTKAPRYYQKNAIQKAIDAISAGQDRLLLTLATGTGKTFIAFQIAYRLLESRWRREDIGVKKPRILYLADRNILIEQALNEFNPIEKDCARIQGEQIRKQGGKVPTSANVFFAIYQAMDNYNRNEVDEQDSVTEYYKQYPANFFDLVIIDECHRGSANDDSSWREILAYFASAVHLGMTATPKRDVNGDSYAYFGEPIYEYSLKDGINDGFLTPYKVRRITTNIDEYRPNDQDYVDGELESRVYTQQDWETKITSEQRHALIAETIIANINKMDKTIVFCRNQAHALALKMAIDNAKAVKNPDYCVRVTADEGKIGRDYLERFQDNDKDLPVILTSSKMLTTGVDAKNVRNIVLTAPIESMIEFKQIIGRGTRTFEGKDFFTILDFVKASDKFYDAEWDGDADVVITVKPEPKGGEGGLGFAQEPDEVFDPLKNLAPETEQKKREPINIVIKGRKLKVLDIETSYVGADGRPMATQEYLEQLVGVLARYCQNSEQILRDAWANPKHRKALLDKLEEMLSFSQNIENIKAIFKAKDSDIYDVFNHLIFSKEMLSREVRAQYAEQSAFVQQLQNSKAKEFLLFVLEKYKKDGMVELEPTRLPALVELSGLGTVMEVSQAYFGGADKMRESYLQLQREIYR